MQDPPRGSYYPAGGINAMQQPRQYQYSATNPWQREEREKVIVVNKEIINVIVNELLNKCK